MAFLSSVIALFSISASLAGRPYATDDAGTVAHGAFELETAANYWSKTADFGMDFKHGLTERMDVGVAFGYAALPHQEAHFSGLVASLKYALVPDLLSASFSGSFGDPVYTANLILSKSISVLSLHGNLGIEAEQSSRNVMFTYGAAAVFAIGSLASGLEIGGTQDAINWWQVGVQIPIARWVALDMGLGGTFQKQEPLTATSGLWFTF